MNCGKEFMQSTRITTELPDIDQYIAESALSAPQPSMRYATAMSASDERMWAMLCHLASLIGWILPFGDLIATLLIWLFKRDQSAFVERHGREALNYQISFYIYALIGLALSCVYIGFFILAALAIFDMVGMIKAAIAANRGEEYRYPLTIRLIKG
jgi:uncharacterized Tic20 family protein